MSTQTSGQPAGGAPAGGAPAGGAPAGGDAGGAAHPVAPWSGSTEVYKIGEAGKEQPWWDSISEQPVRETMNAKQYKNPAELAMAYHNLTKLQRGSDDILAFPKSDAKPEDVATFENNLYTKMGRPEAADKYDIKIPEGTQTDESLLKFGKQMFFDLGASPKKAQAAFDAWQKFATESNAAYAEQQRVANDAEITALDSKWGGRAEEYKAAGNRAVKALGLSNELIAKVEGQIGSAAIVELLATIGMKSGEGTFTGSGNGNGDPNDPNSMTPEQAAAKVKALQADPAFMAAYNDKNNPEHAQKLATMVALFAKAGNKL